MKPIESNIAENALLVTQTATTEVKELITKAVSENLDKKELTKVLNNKIAEYVDKFKYNKNLAKAVKTALIISAKRWHYMLVKTFNTINSNFVNDKAVSEYATTLGVSELLRQNAQGNIIQAFRPYLNYDHAPIVPVIESYKEHMRIALRALSADAPKMVMTQNGRTYAMPLRNYAEMTIRYDANLKNIESVKQSGVKLVWTSSHPNASPRCAPFQGKLWSLDNTTGSINGISYKPIEIALRGTNNDGNGIISGYNCRHRLVEYRAGSKAPNEYSKSEIKKEYKKDTTQRQYENNIRHISTEARLARANNEPERADMLEAKAQRLTSIYKEKSLRMGRAYYPYRYEIDVADTEYAEKIA